MPEESRKRGRRRSGLGEALPGAGRLLWRQGERDKQITASYSLLPAYPQTARKATCFTDCRRLAPPRQISSRAARINIGSAR